MKKLSKRDTPYRLLGENASATEDEFGHDEIVEALAAAVNEVQPPFSIGLVGEWGVGKSFVLRRLEKKLKEKTDKDTSIKVFYFDAWKYAGESVKRSLLESLLNETGMTDTKQGREWLVSLYTTQQKPMNPIVGTSWKLFVLRLVLPLAASGVAYGLLTFLSREGFLPIDRLTALGSAALLGVVTLAVTLANNVTQVAWQTVSVPPVASPDQFERILNGFLNEVFKGDPKSLAVVLIDELDRCDAKTRAEVLQGLRTYLQNDRCVYVVACAPQSIRQGDVDHSSSELPDEEFLRKLFNLTCWIDPQGEENLRTYTTRRLKEAGLGGDPRLMQIVVLGNTSNPRRIRHFLNTLCFALSVARAREKAGRIPDKLVTSNKAFLAKVLILRQDWPEHFKLIVREPRKLRQWTNLESGVAMESGIDKALQSFLYNTDQFIVDNPRPFLAVTMGVALGELKRDSDFARSVIARDIDTANSIVQSRYIDKYHDWSEMLFGELRECRRLMEDQFFINGLVAACSLFEYVPADRQQDYIEEVCDLMQDEDVRQSLPAHAANSVFSLALKARPELRRILLTHYLKTFFKDGKINPAIGDALEKHGHELPTEVRETLNTNVVQTWNQIQGSNPETHAWWRRTPPGRKMKRPLHIL